MLLLFITILFLIIQFRITTGAGAGLICVVWNNYKPFRGVLRLFNTLRYNLPLLTIKAIYKDASMVIQPFTILYAFMNHGNTGRPDGSPKPIFYRVKVQHFTTLKHSIRPPAPLPQKKSGVCASFSKIQDYTNRDRGGFYI